MGPKFRITLPPGCPISKSRTTRLVIELAMCPTWQPTLLKPLELQRTTRPKNAGLTVEGYQNLKAADEVVVTEAKAMVGAEAEATGAPMNRSSMEWTAKTSNDAST